MSILVIAEHDKSSLLPATLNTVTAAGQVGGDVHVLVAGQDCGAIAEAASKIALPPLASSHRRLTLDACRSETTPSVVSAKELEEVSG